MRACVRRILPIALSLVLCLGILMFFAPLPIVAAGGETRFVFSSLSSGDNTYTARGDTVLLPLDGAPTFSARGLSLVSTTGGTNAILVTLVNSSPATELTLTYEYTAYTPQMESVKKTLLPSSDEVQTLIFSMPYIDSATSLSFSFNTDTGSVTLRSFFNVSVHSPSLDEVVKVDACRFNAQTNAVEISGTIDWETTVLYSEATLALFAISPSEDIYLSNKVPVARAGISFTFSFSVPVKGVEDLYYRYIIAAITETGERVPLTTPYYPLISEVAPEHTDSFKGICTENYEKAIAGGAECATVDVSLDLLMGSQNGGILYAGDHSYYYFDADYIARIDAAVQNLTGAGCRVFLRFLVSPGANDLSFVSYTEPGESLLGKGIYIRNEDALMTVYALTDFLTQRYSGGDLGRISGIVLGRTVNRASTYNRTDAKTLAEDTELLAAAFSVISGVSSRNIPGITMMLSLSDSSVEETLTSQELAGEYPADLYLTSFLEALQDLYLSPPLVTVLVESEEMPTLPVAGSGASEDRIEALRALLTRLCREYPNLAEKISYSWQPDATLDAETLQNAYTWLFLRLRLSDVVSSFYLNTSMLIAQDIAAVGNALTYPFTYIDTDRHTATLAPLLAALDISEPTALFPTYTAEQLIRRRIYRFAMTENTYAAAEPKGSYSLWSFATATSTLGWYGGQDCRELSVLSANAGNLLTARLSFRDGFSGVSHSFTYGKQLAFASLLRFEMGIDGTEGTQYEVQVQLIGDKATVLGSAVLRAGERSIYCMDLSTCVADLSDVSCIRLCARPLDAHAEDASLYLHSVMLESTVYNDEELKAQMAVTGNTGENGGTGEEARDYTTPIIVTVALILASAFIVIILVIRYRNRKYQKEADER